MSWNDLKEFSCFMGLVFGGMLVFFFFIWCLLAPMSSYSCSRYGDNVERNVKFDYFMLECFVEYKGEWYSRDEFGKVLIATGLREG